MKLSNKESTGLTIIDILKFHEEKPKYFQKNCLPIENIEESVESKSSYIMRSNILNQSDFVEHYNLRDESNRLKPETVAPNKLPR